MNEGFIASGDRCLLPHVRRATGGWERMRGLLGHPPLKPGEGLLIVPCNSVHTAGMGYPLDLAFLDRHGCILKTVASLAPWRLALCGRARMTLELPSGSLHSLALEPGMTLTWRPAWEERP